MTTQQRLIFPPRWAIAEQEKRDFAHQSIC